ncbi:unnamed protein product [Rodentolepis nana]|uniref:Uncharacterized protein n=1 Tax=Rodentolepis nana TaxID=102285 RepID=A0A0R3THJ0_RODNA|nr:unnamed protein product [Rodentolepis nana]
MNDFSPNNALYPVFHPSDYNLLVQQLQVEENSVAWHPSSTAKLHLGARLPRKRHFHYSLSWQIYRDLFTHRPLPFHANRYAIDVPLLLRGIAIRLPLLEIFKSPRLGGHGAADVDGRKSISQIMANGDSEWACPPNYFYGARIS